MLFGWKDLPNKIDLFCIPTDLSRIPPVLQIISAVFHLTCIQLVLHPTCPGTNLFCILLIWHDCIPPVLHPICPAFQLYLYFTCPVSHLSCIPPVLHPTGPASDLSCIRHDLHLSCPVFHMSCIPLDLHLTGPASV